MLAAMVRVIWLAEHLPSSPWTGTNATVTNHQVVETLDQHPKLREFVPVGERVAGETGRIKSAAGAGSYLVSAANPTTGLEDWFDGIIEGSGLARDDPRLVFRKLMFTMTRQQAGQVQRRRDTREHVTLYLTAFNALALPTPDPAALHPARPGTGPGPKDGVNPSPGWAGGAPG